MLREPVLVPDSLVGRRAKGPGGIVALALVDVRTLETRHTKTAATTLTILGAAAGGLFLVLAIGCAASDCSVN